MLKKINLILGSRMSGKTIFIHNLYNIVKAYINKIYVVSKDKIYLETLTDILYSLQDIDDNNFEVDKHTLIIIDDFDDYNYNIHNLIHRCKLVHATVFISSQYNMFAYNTRKLMDYVFVSRNTNNLRDIYFSYFFKSHDANMRKHVPPIITYHNFKLMLERISPFHFMYYKNGKFYKIKPKLLNELKANDYEYNEENNTLNDEQSITN